MSPEDAERRLTQARRALLEARREYTAAIAYCVEQRISNIKMGSIVGVSETAIRMYRKRHGI